MSLVQRINAGLWSVCYSAEPLAAGCTESEAESEREGALQLKPESGPNPAQPVTTSATSLKPSCDPLFRNKPVEEMSVFQPARKP